MKSFEIKKNYKPFGFKRNFVVKLNIYKYLTRYFYSINHFICVELMYLLFNIPIKF